MIDRERLQEMLNIAPFHRWLGLEIATCSDQGIAITMPWREEIVSNPMIGSAHGGILASLVDLTGLYTLLAGASRRERRPICMSITTVLQPQDLSLLTDRS